jgi:hypothetical protein
VCTRAREEENILFIFTEKCKYSAEKKLTKRDERKKAASNTPQATGRHAKKKAASNTPQATGRHAKKKAASNMPQATSRHATKEKSEKKTSACDVCT